MEKEFVPYELAVKLKELGFDEPCFGQWLEKAEIEGGGIVLEMWNDEDTYFEVKSSTKAPTFSQAFRWFREKYGLYSHVRESYSFDNTLEFVSQINGSYVNHGISDKPINRFDTYEEAELACLTKLFEIVESKSE